MPLTPSPTDICWMRLALSLARRGLGRVAPNPAVGCVIVKDGCLIGRGWTQDGGRPHAETMALAQAQEIQKSQATQGHKEAGKQSKGGQIKGATAYVTLEPCAHHGQTPPCARALIDSGLARVVTAMQDPDPRVSGKGHQMITDAGIALTTGVCEAEARAINLGFLMRIQQTRPLVTLKLASSVDGRLATKTGQSQWITGATSRAHAHALRSLHDAIMVGSNTVMEDDPDLRPRLGGEPESRVRMVVDSQLRTPADSKLMQTAEHAPLWLYHDKNTTPPKDSPARLIGVKKDSGGLSLPDILADAAANGITRILCEGGGQLAASLLAADLVDRLVTFHAPLAIGGDGLPSIGNLNLNKLDKAPRFTLTHTQTLDGDIMTHWHRAP